MCQSLIKILLTVRNWGGLRVRRGQQRHIVSPPPAQRGASVLLPISQRLGQRLPLALGQQQDRQHGQQGQRGVDHMVQEVTVVVPQVHEWGAEAAHTAQGEHCAHTGSSVDTTQPLIYHSYAMSQILRFRPPSSNKNPDKSLHYIPFI